ncbi:MAG: type VI secretion system contractile sheath large subunit, partial [Planctomycetota bacterium]
MVHAAEEAGGDVEIAVLAVGWAEIARDVMNAVEFDRSQMFAKIYSEAIGTAGGAPFGVVLVDHEFAAATHTPTGHRELEVVERLAGIAAAAFCPIILGTSPRMLGLESFSELS